MTDRDRRAIVVLVGDSPWHGHRLAAQHIAERLTRYARVLYVDPPMSPVGIRRLRHSYDVDRWRGLHPLDAPGLYRLGALVNPAKTRRWGRAAAGVLLRAQVRRAVRRLGGPVHAVIQIPIHYPLLGLFDERFRVHLASDDFVAAAIQNGVDEAWVRSCEDEIARRASDVIAVSQPLMQRWRARGFEPALVPNGCDVELYATTDDVAPAADVTLAPPIAGFVGTISDRTDVGLLEALADEGRSILLVGPRSFTAPNEPLDALFARSNVQWVGARPYTELPAYLQLMKVGLVPYRATDFNNASFPLKTLDYLAAGRAVVSTDIPAMATIGDDVVAVASSTKEFVDAVEDALDADDTGLVAARRARAAMHSWEARVADIARVIDLDGGDASPS